MFKQVVRRFSTNTRPFNILGIQQIAIGGLSKQKLVNLWSDEFGIKAVGEFKSERENVDETILSLGQGAHAVEIDLMQPLDPTRSPKVHDPSLNHIGLWVDNIKVAVDHLTKRGMRFTPGGIRKGAAGFDVVFIHPKGNEQFPLCGQGVLIELVQAPEEVIKALGKSN
jgi:lactoylglutathione lyase